MFQQFGDNLVVIMVLPGRHSLCFKGHLLLTAGNRGYFRFDMDGTSTFFHFSESAVPAKQS